MFVILFVLILVLESHRLHTIRETDEGFTEKTVYPAFREPPPIMYPQSKE